MKRIEKEKEQQEMAQEKEKKTNAKRTWREEIMFFLYIILFPKKLEKKFSINERVYDSILVMGVSAIFQLVGGFFRLGGLIALIYGK